MRQATAERFGLKAWAALLLRLIVALLILEFGTRGLLAVKAYIERDLPECYEFVTTRCRTPAYNAELTDVIQFDLLVGASHVPNYRGRLISTNSQGFRGTTDYGTKPPGTLRVGVIGGSAAWGTFVHDDETIPAHLEVELSERLDRPVEVINAAVTGASSFQELVRLEADVLPLEPDVVVVFDGRNDLYFANSPKWNAVRTPAIQGYEAAVRAYAEAEPQALLDVAWRAGLRGSAFLRAVDAVSLSVRVQQNANAPPALHPEAVDAYERNLLWMAGVVQAAGAYPVFALQPILQPGAKPLSAEEEIILSRRSAVSDNLISLYPLARAAFRRLSEREGLTALDYADIFAEVTAQLYFDDTHYLSDGNRIIATRLADDITTALDTDTP